MVVLPVVLLLAVPRSSNPHGNRLVASGLVPHRGPTTVERPAGDDSNAADSGDDAETDDSETGGSETSGSAHSADAPDAGHAAVTTTLAQATTRAVRPIPTRRLA